MARGRKPEVKFAPVSKNDAETVVHWTDAEVIIGTNHPTVLKKLSAVTKPTKVLDGGFTSFTFPLKDFNFQLIPKKKSKRTMTDEHKQRLQEARKAKVQKGIAPP